MKNPVKKPSWWEEFKTFAVKGNAMALAVGTIIGGAFSTITHSCACTATTAKSANNIRQILFIIFYITYLEISFSDNM